MHPFSTRSQKRSVGTQWRLIIIVAILPLSGCGAKFSPKQIAYTEDTWNFKGAQGRKLTSVHYEIHSTCKNRPFVDAMPAFLETSYDAYAKLLPTTTTPHEPMKTYLFQTRWQWERFTEEFAPDRAVTYKRIRNGGYSERGITVSQYASQRSTLSTMAHEGLHQYLEMTGRSQIPAWLNEGLACYFESFDLVNNRPVFKPELNTLRTPALREAMVSNSLLPLKDVLATNAGLAVQQKAKHVLSCYGEWWSLILFLMRPEHENVYYKGFHEMLSELGTEAMHRKAKAFLAADSDGTMSFGEAVFRAYITEDLTAFESEYHDYLQKLLGLHAG